MNREIETALAELNACLRHQFVDTKLITVEQWNDLIAPKLSNLSMKINNVTVTAHTYRLPENYFD